jgi:hypothetical protein
MLSAIQSAATGASNFNFLAKSRVLAIPAAAPSMHCCILPVLGRTLVRPLGYMGSSASSINDSGEVAGSGSVSFTADAAPSQSAAMGF